MGKKSITKDVIMRAMEFEKERFTGVEAAERLRGARLREVDFIDS
jgi:hypothetical protein